MTSGLKGASLGGGLSQPAPAIQLGGEGGWDSGGFGAVGLGCVLEVKSTGLANRLGVVSGGDWIPDVEYVT